MRAIRSEDLFLENTMILRAIQSKDSFFFRAHYDVGMRIQFCSPK